MNDYKYSYINTMAMGITNSTVPVTECSTVPVTECSTEWGRKATTCKNTYFGSLKQQSVIQNTKFSIVTLVGKMSNM